MVIATSGQGSGIRFTRIISSSSLPYSVINADSKTFRDSALGSSKRLRGLFINDKNNLVALIWDSSSDQTDVATLNLQIPSISYQPSLPIIKDMQIGVFMTASVYYTTSYDNNFFKDLTTTNKVGLNNQKSHGIVYTSDMSMNSCYTMQSAPSS